MFNQEELFCAALMIQEPLYVSKVMFDSELGELHIHIDFRKGMKFECPICHNKNLKVHDTIEKTWRHLNFFQYKAFIHFRTPRIDCPEHGVHMLEAPWAKKNSGFTMLFEALALQLALCMPVQKAAQILGVHDTLMWRIVKRYVDQARAKADYSKIKSVGVDETACKRGHSYVTLFVDMDKSQVVHVAEGKDNTTIKSFKNMLQERKIKSSRIQNFSADMSPAFRKGIKACFPKAALTIDKFHVMKLMNEAVDAVRREEQKHQHPDLKGSRYIWLKNRQNLNKVQNQKLDKLSSMNLKTARAYRIKLALQEVYKTATDRFSGMTALQKWYGWVCRCKLEPVKTLAKTIRGNWSELLNHFDSGLTNGLLEGVNSIVQAARSRARGYRNIQNFITMIFLLRGKLELEIK